MARYGSSCCPRIWKSASTPSHGCAASHRQSSSLSPSTLLSTDRGTRDFPMSWKSAASPRSYSCNLLSPRRRPSATEKMQTLTECVKVYSS